MTLAYPKSKKRPRQVNDGRLQGEELAELRQDCWDRDGGHCQRCGVLTSFDAPHFWMFSYHMSHIRAKAVGGDNLANVETLCGACHREFHACGPSMEKPCPPK